MGMNNPDHISETLIKILKFFDGSGIRDGNNPDPDGKKSDPG
jgi:hypothetical protein